MLKTATFIASVAPSVGILHGDSGDASQPLVRGASGLLEALFHDNERAPGAKLHGMILTFGFRRSCALSADLSIQYADDAVCADRTKQNRMLNFNVEDRVGTIVIERASAGNAFTEAMVRQLGEIIRRAAEEADIVTLSGAGADFTIGRDRGEPKSGSPFDAFRNISALNKAIAEFPGLLITGVRGRAFGLGFGLIMRSDIAIAAANTRFALDEVKLGIPPMFIMEQILEHLPAKRALDFILTGREFGADDALQIGLISRVVGPDDLDGRMGEFVATLRSRGRRVVLACKRYLRAVGKMPPEARSAYALVEQTQFTMGDPQ
jgi:enoyl-CoA hydratase/carnithine racemase